MSVRVIVCGSRGWGDRQRIQDALADVAEEFGTCDLTIVHGAAKGADRIAADEAGKHGFLVEAHPADWGAHGKAAGLIRNEYMARMGAHLCVAFWDGRSTGTAHMMDTARAYGIPVRVVSRCPGVAGAAQ